MEAESFYDTKLKYWDVDEWRKYIKESIGEIYNFTSTLMELRELLESYVDKDLGEVIDEDERLLPFFVGGIDTRGIYVEESLAKLVKNVVGVHVDPASVSGAISLYGADGYKKVKVEATEPSFYLFVKVLNLVTKEILNQSGVKPNDREVTLRNILEHPETLLDVLKGLYDALLKFSANHNYYTFFIMSTRGLHKKYLVLAYPKLRNKETFRKISEFLGIIRLFSPSVDDEVYKEAYTVFGYEPGKIGDLIWRLQVILWNVLSSYPKLSLIKFEDSTIKLDPNEVINTFKEFIVISPLYIWNEYIQVVEPHIKDIESNLQKNQKTLLNEITGDFGIWDIQVEGKMVKYHIWGTEKYSNSDAYYFMPKLKSSPLDEFMDAIGIYIFGGVFSLLSPRDSLMLKEVIEHHLFRNVYDHFNYISRIQGMFLLKISEIRTLIIPIPLVVTKNESS